MSGVSGRGRRDERGSGTVLAATIVLGLSLVLAVGAVVVGWSDCRTRAHRVADLAALAGAHEHARGGEGCRRAAEVARRNAVTLSSCRVEGDTRSFVVRVVVTAELRPHLRGGPARVSASSTAGTADGASSRATDGVGGGG